MKDLRPQNCTLPSRQSHNAPSTEKASAMSVQTKKPQPVRPGNLPARPSARRAYGARHDSQQLQTWAITLPDKAKDFERGEEPVLYRQKREENPQNYVNLQSYAIALQSRKNRKTGKSRTDCVAAPSSSKPPHPTEMASPHAA